ncbi:hypothetical protein ACFYO9_14480 [Streptomyces sp. NPDC005863]|uniref:hypothetical protein n=1 Tax=unclassified Streptomyces TaxID=2593676 RepID=UPI0034040571
MLTVYSALAAGLWVLVLGLSIMTAGAGGRDTLTLSERMALPATRSLAKRRGDTLAEKVDSLDASIRLSPQAQRYLQHEDLLAMVEMWGMGVRWVPTGCLGLATGGLLALRVSRSELGVWTDSLAQFVFVAIAFLTMLVLLWTSTPQKSRWTTWPMSGNARRAFITLLTEIPGNADVSDLVFRQPQAPAVRDLENLAYSMEHYALKRALPNTRNPMIEVVRIFGSAAQDVRSLRDAVEIDREGGRDHALREVRRMIEVLASGSVRALAAPMEDPSALLQQTMQRSYRARRGVFVALFTVVACLLAVVLIRAELPEPAAVVIAAVLGLWVQQLRLTGDAA